MERMRKAGIANAPCHPLEAPGTWAVALFLYFFFDPLSNLVEQSLVIILEVVHIVNHEAGLQPKEVFWACRRSPGKKNTDKSLYRQLYPRDETTYFQNYRSLRPRRSTARPPPYLIQLGPPPQITAIPLLRNPPDRSP